MAMADGSNRPTAGRRMSNIWRCVFETTRSHGHGHVAMAKIEIGGRDLECLVLYIRSSGRGRAAQ
jgi:hypothetical protein